MDHNITYRIRHHTLNAYYMRYPSFQISFVSDNRRCHRERGKENGHYAVVREKRPSLVKRRGSQTRSIQQQPLKGFFLKNDKEGRFLKEVNWTYHKTGACSDDMRGCGVAETAFFIDSGWETGVFIEYVGYA